MNKLVLVMLTTAALSLPAAAAQNQPQNSGQGQQSSQSSRQQGSQNAANRQNSGNQAQQKSAQNRTVSPTDMSRQRIRQVQEALNKKGLDAGHVDGIWGPDTRTALENFQKSHGMQANGQLNHRTLSALGVRVARSNQSSGSQTTGAGRSRNDARQPSSSQSSSQQRGSRH